MVSRLSRAALGVALLLTSPSVALADVKTELDAATQALAAKDYEKAAGILDRVAKAPDLTADDTESIAIARAHIHMMENREDAAVAELQASAKANPASFRALHGLAELHWRARTFDKAAQAYEAAVAKAKDTSEGATALRLDHGWFLATCPDAKYRDGARAVAYAEEAFKALAAEKREPLASTIQSLRIFEVLAAGQAELGKFDVALAAARLAANARASLRGVLPDRDFTRKDFDRRLAGYEARKPWRDLGE